MRHKCVPVFVSSLAGPVAIQDVARGPMYPMSKWLDNMLSEGWTLLGFCAAAGNVELPQIAIFTQE